MAINDLFKVVLKGGYLGRPTINVFHYKQVSGSPSDPALDLNGGFVASIATGLANVINVSATYTEVDVYNLTNPTDFAEVAFDAAIVGLVAGDGLPPYATWSFKYLRTVLGIKPGRKGIAGVSESFQVNGNATAPAIVLLDEIALAFEGDVTGGGGGAYAPGVLSTIFGGSPRVTPIFMPTRSVLFEGIGTQNSRKFGR